MTTDVKTIDPKQKDKSKEFATPFWYQFVQLYVRLNVVFWRSPNYK